MQATSFIGVPTCVRAIAIFLRVNHTTFTGGRQDILWEGRSKCALRALLEMRDTDRGRGTFHEKSLVWFWPACHCLAHPSYGRHWKCRC